MTCFYFAMKENVMASLYYNTEAIITQAFISSTRNLDDLLNIHDLYFEYMVGRFYASELQINKANVSGTEAPDFFYLHLSISNEMHYPNFMINAVTDFYIVNFPFRIGTFPVLPLTLLKFLNLFDLLVCLVV